MCYTKLLNDSNESYKIFNKLSSLLKLAQSYNTGIFQS